MDDVQLKKLVIGRKYVLSYEDYQHGDIWEELDSDEVWNAIIGKDKITCPYTGREVFNFSNKLYYLEDDDMCFPKEEVERYYSYLKALPDMKIEEFEGLKKRTTEREKSWGIAIKILRRGTSEELEKDLGFRLEAGYIDKIESFELVPVRYSNFAHLLSHKMLGHSRTNPCLFKFGLEIMMKDLNFEIVELLKSDFTEKEARFYLKKVADLTREEED